MMTKDQARELAVWIVATLVLMFLVTVITVDKTPKRYYVAEPWQQQRGVLAGWCVYGASDYDRDDAAFCSSDIDKVLQVHAALNRGVR